jgi:DNA-directed RNA polymerase subunit K/omega
MDIEAKIHEEQNKYEAVMVISKESRRINNRLRGQNVEFKVTSLAMQRYLDGSVKWEYWEPAEHEEVGRSAVEGMVHAGSAAGLPGPIEAAAAEGVTAPVEAAEKEEVVVRQAAREGAEG